MMRIYRIASIITIKRDMKWVISILLSGFICLLSSCAESLLIEDTNDADIHNDVDNGDYHIQIVEEFTVPTNGINPYSNSLLEKIPSSSHKGGEIYYHEAYLSVPSGYGKCSLIIVVGGADALATWVRDYCNIGKIWNALGYAVLGVMGWSREWKTDHSLENSNPSGNWMATEAVVKAYQYVVNKYDFIDPNGCFMYGESQGGCVVENVAETQLIPVLATILDSPVLSLQYHQFVNRYDTYSSVRARLDSYYHFNGTFNKNKVVGCDPFTRNMSDDIVMTVTGTGVTDIHTDVKTVATKKYRSCKTPIMILVGEGDTILAEDVQLVYIKALQNAGMPVCAKYYSGLLNQRHGCIECSPTVTINGFETGRVFYDVLEYMAENGGYFYRPPIN